MVIKNKILFFLLLFLLFCLILLSKNYVYAQFGFTPFSGNNPESYRCIDDPSEIPQKGDDGYFYCTNGKRALLKPPPIQQLEILFKRIVYVVWAAVASFSFLAIVYLGYRIMLRWGTTDKELVKLRKDLLNFVFGFALVFLSIPILTTFFRLLNINTNVECYDVAMPGFQFFFPELCTDSIGLYYQDDPANMLRNLARKIQTERNVSYIIAYNLAKEEVESTVCDQNRYPQEKTSKEFYPFNGGICITFTIRCMGTWQITIQEQEGVRACPR